MVIISCLYTTVMYRENAIAIESEASDSLMYRSNGFARKERDLYCGVNVAAKNKHPLPSLIGSLDSFWIASLCKKL